jgi:hypothetical protein
MLPEHVLPRPMPDGLRMPRGVLLLNEAFAPLVDGVITVVDSLYRTLRERGVFTHIVTVTQPGYLDRVYLCCSRRLIECPFHATSRSGCR